MGHLVYIKLLCVLAISYSNGCDMSPPGTLWLPQSITIKDTFRGVVFSTETINILGVQSVISAQNLNRGPYFSGSLQGSTFTLSTNDAFDDYEEYETINNPNLNIIFNCVGGTTRSLTFIISITDTNNNAPRFIPPTNELEFTVIPPLPPGFSITGCFEEITVRDIDLTTERIDFEIFGSSLFEIAYDAALSTVPKEFKATLKTTTFIRSIPEPIEFKISATDVDQTGDPPLTVTTTVRIKSLEGGFELPDEPVFTQAYYMATYTKDHQVILEEIISLQQGYTDSVQFSLEQVSGTTHHFAITENGNEISLTVVTPLTADVLLQRQIRLVIKAELENTSGANAAIIIELPEEEELKFAQPVYNGAIVDNVLQLTQLVLSQGYQENNVSVEILDYAEFFEVKLEQNVITLSMSPLDANIIEENTFLSLRVVASTNSTSVLTVVTLEIIKDDTVTPIFDRAVYEGLYNGTEGLNLEPIILVQGYDQSVDVTLQGDHGGYFKLDQVGPIINLKLDVPSLPTELFSEQNLLLYLRATKPRTVGATTAISIALPAETQLEFEEQYYKGVIEDDVLYLTELTLSNGYEEDNVTVSINSIYASFFQANIEVNKITLSMSPLDDETIQQNSFLNLEIVATASRSSASAIVTLEIIKDDFVTPVFERTVYEGSYDLTNGLTLEEIMLTQGFDETVEFSLQGEHSGYFQIVRLGPLINLTASSLPSEMFLEQNLILSIEATKPRTVGANAAITISLPAEIPLEFEKPNYNGFIEDNALQLTQLTLSQGYDNDPVSVSITNDYASYFEAEIVQNKITLSMLSLDNHIIEENNFINLHVIASTNRSSAITIVTLEIIKNDTLTPVFERAVYEGTYDTNDGLKLEDIVLVQGYDETVKVVLQGEYAGFFQLVQLGPIISLTTATLPDHLLSMHTLLLSIEATKSRTVGANAAISITLPDARKLEFAAETYTGAIRENLLQVENIILSVGYTEDVVFTLTGEYASYFNVTNVQNQISVDIQSPIPDSVIEEHNFLLLTLSASSLNAVSASTTIAIEVIKEDLTTPLFSQNIYYGTYAGPSSFNSGIISLSQGFDDKVSFRLDGEHSQYFKTSVSVNGAVSLELQTVIPEEVIFNEKVLLFSILAEKELTVGANAAVSIIFPPELTEPSIMRFARNIYIGSLQQNTLNLEDIVLEIGYATGTQFELLGDFSEYFTLTSSNNVVRILATNLLPTDILKTKFILLEVEARRPRAVSVSTTILIDIGEPEIVVPPVFTRAYYRGIYTQENGLQFEDDINLSQGFDDTVSFSLDGESSQWFDFKLDNGTVSIILLKQIPTEVIEANSNLLFSIIAQKPNANDGRAVVSVDLCKANVGEEILGFDRLSYTGSIANNVITMSSIVLSEGPTSGVTFTLHGELSEYFTVTSQSSNVIVALPNPIPIESIPSNRIIVLEIQASAPQAAPAYATIVLHVVVDDGAMPAVPDLVFDATYYVGSYTANGGLVLSTPITLAEGYDPDVVFALEGDNSQWFSVTNSGSSVTLSLTSPIPPAIVANNQKLILVIRAERPGGHAARATVVISLADEIVGEDLLGFDRLSYTGSIANNVITMSSIVLSEGPTSGVTFTLHGELSEYFTVTSQGSNVIVALPNPIPIESIPSNRIIVLEIQASAPQAAPAYATIVLHVVVDDGATPVVPDLVFDATYYVGSYTANGGLVLSTPITLAEGYDPDVVFALEGDNSQWFSVTNSGSSITLLLNSPIPPAVVANNQKLILVIRAERPGGHAARATVVISLADEIVGEDLLGFDRLSYTGSIANNVIAMSSIVLSEGPTSGVTFTLHGELSEYFTVTSQGSNVIVALPNPIPIESIPLNRIIVLEIQASAPQAAPAYATIVLHVVVDDGATPVVPDLVFDATYYVGSYTANGGLVLSTPITLAEGYDPDVVFALEGDNSQWFSVTNSGSSVTLSLTSPIPPAVVANNQKVILVIRAERPGGHAARATVIISLADEFVGEDLLGFDRLSYTGSIANNVITMSSIVLSEGPTSGVTFTLHGELSEYFTVTSQGSNVIVALPNPIPIESIPSNRIIVLEIQASAPQIAPAYATIVLHVVVDDGATPAVPNLVFDATYYVGSYTANGGLVLSTPITLAEGYDPDVVFVLEGDNSQWFSVTNSGSSVTLSLTSPIPPAIVANNQKLILVIRAERPGGHAARATVVISLADGLLNVTEIVGEDLLGFDRLSYTGSIANNVITMSSIVLSEGPTSGVTFTLHGELSEYFTVTSQGSNVIVALPNPIPIESIPSNRIIVLEIQASAPQATPAYATIVLPVVVDDGATPVVPDLVFDATYYVGSYTANGGLVLSTPITLAEGYDPDVVFALEGDNSQWFSVTNSGSSVTLSLTSPIPPAVVANNQKLILVIRAERPRGHAARATVVISLADEIVGEDLLGFDRLSYTGSITNNVITMSSIVLSEGPTSGVTFTLHGELSEYFTVTSQGSNVIVALPNPIPIESIPSNRIIVLEIQASAPQAAPAYATIVLHVVVDDGATPAVPNLVFDATYYVGSYTANGGLVLSTPITLAEGYDPDVVFAVEGDNSQWFSVTNSGSSVTLSLTSPIPPAVVANNQKVILVIRAERPGGHAARATVVISLADEIVGEDLLGFDRLSYTGSIANNVITMSSIVLSEGPTSGVTFTLHGELSEYFTVTSQGSNVIVALPNSIPIESIPLNRIIVLEIQASAPQAAPAYATIVLHVVVDDGATPAVPNLVFDATYYVGSYTANGGLVLSTPITLAEGYGPDVVFALEGDNSQWFSVTNSGSSVTLSLTSPIPPAVVANNQKLILVIRAERPGSHAARATVVISLADEIVGEDLLGFDRLSYTGSIANNVIAMSSIVLSEGPTSGVTFTLHGELSEYFTVTSQGSNVIVALPNPIPIESIPSNRIIVLEIQASAPQAAPAYATIVLHVVADDGATPAVPDLVFDATYYVGSYTANGGLVLSTPITLAEGYDPDVVFALEGDNSQWFSVTNSGSSVTLSLTSPIPPAVVANNQKLILVIRAERPGGHAARATVVISLADEIVGEDLLGFDRLSYTGSIANNVITMSSIFLSEGPTSGVTFTLHGELSEYFTVTSQGSNVIVALPNPIPIESIPSNRIIVLEIQASAPQAAPAYATIVLHVVADDGATPAVPDLVFDATYYVGSYTANGGLVLSTPITLAEGYDPDVVFALEGDNSQWFSVTNSGSSVTLSLTSPIPPAVVANNQKLILVIRAERPGGHAARATVVISLADEIVGEDLLGFDRLSYTGSIANNVITMSSIVLSEGPTSGVTFTLHGELSEYFTVTSQGSNVIVALPNPIPIESIPSNRIIVLEIQASAPQAAPAYATIVLHVVVDDGATPVVPDLVFDATYYVGSYTANGGLVLSTPITLAEGYDPDVVFALEGDNSQWFSVTNLGSSITLSLTSPIPPAIVANNQKLILVIRAERPGGHAARATVVISLADEIVGEDLLGFDRLSYTGSIANNVITMSSIVLSEGPTSGVTFTLHGELSEYFTVTSQGSNVIVALPNPIPIESIPSNRIILLEIQASAPQAAPAYATIVLHVVVDDGATPVVPDLVFDATYYVGSYTANGGLVLSTPITLAEGYDPDVVFALEGDNSQWFSVTNSGSSVTLSLTTPIPPTVVANNQKLILVIRAERPGGHVARATVVISLADEIVGEDLLGFDRLSYTGSIANNVITMSSIVLSEGPTSGVTFTLHGELSEYFTVTSQGSNVIVALPNPIPVESIPANRIIVLEIQASAPQAAPAYATIVLHVVVDDGATPAVPNLVFDATYYVGSYTANGGLVLSTPITLAEGFDPDVVFALEGDYSQWFSVTNSGSSVTLSLTTPIPPTVVANNQKLILVIRAEKPGGHAARATVVISLADDHQESSVSFDKVLYEGIIQSSAVYHEVINLLDYDGTDINIIGTLSSSFHAIHSDGKVVVQAVDPLTLPPGTQHVVLELQVADTGAVLSLQVTATEQPLPTVTFEHEYVFSVESQYTGPLGQVRASADTGEAVTYSLVVGNEHLQTRLSLSSDGELRLSAPVEKGVYTFQVIATTVFTQALGQTTVQLTVEDAVDGPVLCGDDNIVIAPLIIINRDEEEEHRDLVPLNATELSGCYYTLTNRWPVDQNWLYVDDSGLHTNAIDREDQRIAFMALSQVQVELNIVCEDEETRTKRSSDKRLHWLGPYDYGANKWVLTDSIAFNPRRSIVNLIVNDINDNDPIFVGIEDQPIAVGYPISDLEETIMPRSLAELQATDADVGENAELLYWSEDPEIAVSPATGFVHVRTNAQLQENMILTVNATDRNGEGRTGSITLMIKLLDTENIAVVTIRDAFLEDESWILGNLSNAIGYEVRALRSVVVPTTPQEEMTRKKRDATTTSGTSLEVYVYGLIEKEPVAVDKLSNDINSAAIVTVDIASILSLGDHLEGNQICAIPGRDTGLLAATIVLSILLFILIVAAVVWYLLKRKKQENYDQFSDATSLASQNESLGRPAKPELVAKPRLNIEELKRSERRLQDMLNAPIPEVTVEPTPSSSKKDPILETKIPVPDPLAPIVIQDKLKDASEDSDEDEFGERKKARRKSVVTFNENVEKIIHVDDEPDITADPNLEVYKF